MWMLATNIIKSYGHLIQGSCPVLGLGGVSKKPLSQRINLLQNLIHNLELLWAPVNKKMKPTVPEIRISSIQDVQLLVSQE